MSDNWEIDVDDEDYDEAPRALREAYKKLQKQVTALTSERDEFRSKWQSRAIGDVLSGQNFKNPKRVERDLLADKVDLADDSAVRTWLEENGSDYARSEESAPEPVQEEGQQTTNPLDEREAVTRQQIAQSQTYAQPSALSALDAAKAEITPEMTGDDVIAVYKKHGVF